MAKIPLVDLKAQYATIQPEIDAAIARVIANTSFIGGVEVTNFEAAFAQFQQTKRSIGIASGTGALYLVLRALGIGAGDEVITSPHTFIATVEPIEQIGAKTVFVDIDPVNYNLDPALIEAAITPRTKAIMPVHLYGQLAPMEEIMEIARQHNLYVIEDAAQAHGAELHGVRAGNWGHAACFSFYPGKNLGAYGDAGAVCTNDEALATMIAKLKDHGRMSKYEHDELGYGERLDGLQAAIFEREAAASRRLEHGAAAACGVLHAGAGGRQRAANATGDGRRAARFSPVLRAGERGSRCDSRRTKQSRHWRGRALSGAAAFAAGHARLQGPTGRLPAGGSGGQVADQPAAVPGDDGRSAVAGGRRTGRCGQRAGGVKQTRRITGVIRRYFYQQG